MKNKEESTAMLARPHWIRGKTSWSKDFARVRDLLQEERLNSVCVSAACPNKGECWEKRHVTFMIMGDICTRGCLFCNVTGGNAKDIDNAEPQRVAAAVKELGLEYVVVTSVTRDDLPDKGAGHFVKTVKAIKDVSPSSVVELLIPDLGGDAELIKQIAFSGAEVVGHNIEVPERLYREVRTGASYDTSLNVLRALAGSKKEGLDIMVKSSIILGLGEEKEDVLRTLEDLDRAGIDIVYLGQYLSPSRAHWPVKKYYTPKEFAFFEEKARNIGFKAICSGPMVRSSYRAQETYIACS